MYANLNSPHDMKQAQRYFNPSTSTGPILLIVFGSLFGLVGLADLRALFIFLLIGIGMVVGGIFWLKNQRESRVSDAELDSIVQRRFNDLKHQAFVKLGVEESAVNAVIPLVAIGYEFFPTLPVKVGQDGRPRSPWAVGSIILFGEHELYVYQRAFDLRNATPPSESSGSYFYQDIVSVETATETRQVGPRVFGVEVLRVTTRGGTALTATLARTSDVQQGIDRSRNFIRAKKTEPQS